MKKTILFAVSFLAAGAVWAQQASTQAVNADSVPIEEYVPKVVIEGKWGAGPGEFGVAWTYADDVNVPQNESGEIPPIYPGSLAVNSSGDIYVLDKVNNRIQKFNAAGNHILSLSVDSYKGKEQAIWYGKIMTKDGKEVLDRVIDKTKQGSTPGIDRWFPFYWPLTVEGINIVIDSKDTLYYYLKRTKDGKETGEVWEFRKDKLVKKTAVPSVPGGLSCYDGVLWITEYPYELVTTDIGTDFNVFEGKKYLRKDINMLKKQKMVASIQDPKNYRERHVFMAGSKEEVRLAPVSGEEFVSPGTIRDSKALVVSLMGEEKILNEYDLSGKLLRRLRVESRPQNGLRDSRDNFYIISNDNTGVRVTKYIREVVR